MYLLSSFLPFFHHLPVSLRHFYTASPYYVTSNKAMHTADALEMKMSGKIFTFLVHGFVRHDWKKTKQK